MELACPQLRSNTSACHSRPSLGHPRWGYPGASTKAVPMPPPGHQHTSLSWQGPSPCEAPGPHPHRHSLVHTLMNTFKCLLRYPQPLRAGDLMPLRPLASVPSPLQPHSNLVTQDSGEVNKRSMRPQVRTVGMGAEKSGMCTCG